MLSLFKTLKKKVVKSIVIYGGLHRYIPVLAGQNKFRVTEIIVNHRSRLHGSSKYGGSRLLHGFFDLITILFLNRFIQQPLHLFGSFGIGLLTIGFIIESCPSFTTWVTFGELGFMMS